MSNLNIYLPPYSPDYSGAASALYELGGMLVLHDASGCTGNVLGYDEPRWENAASSRALVFCSAYRHLEAILGQDDKVVSRIVDAAESLKPKFIAIIGSPVPMLVGTDYSGLAKEIEAECGIPAFGFDTKGLEFYDNGYTKATVALLRRYSKKRRTVPKTLNLLGLTPIDFGNVGNDIALKDFFEGNGWRINTSFSMGFSLEDVEKAGEAELNIAVSECGVEVAEFMKEHYGIPYITGIPLGDSRAFMSKISGNLGSCSENTNSRRILIIGEQVASCSLRDEIRLRGNISVDVAIPFSHRKELLEPEDYPFVQEKDLIKIVNSGRYSDIVGDPLFRDLLHNPDVSFYDMAHVGISSKFHWDEVRHIIGPEMDSFISSII